MRAGEKTRDEIVDLSLKNLDTDLRQVIEVVKCLEAGGHEWAKDHNVPLKYVCKRCGRIHFVPAETVITGGLDKLEAHVREAEDARRGKSKT